MEKSTGIFPVEKRNLLVIIPGSLQLSQGQRMGVSRDTKIQLNIAGKGNSN